MKYGPESAQLSQYLEVSVSDLGGRIFRVRRKSNHDNEFVNQNVFEEAYL